MNINTDFYFIFLNRWKLLKSYPKPCASPLPSNSLQLWINRLSADFANAPSAQELFGDLSLFLSCVFTPVVGFVRRRDRLAEWALVRVRVKEDQPEQSEGCWKAMPAEREDEICRKALELLSDLCSKGEVQDDNCLDFIYYFRDLARPRYTDSGQALWYKAFHCSYCLVRIKAILCH